MTKARSSPSIASGANSGGASGSRCSKPMVFQVGSTIKTPKFLGENPCKFSLLLIYWMVDAMKCSEKIKDNDRNVGKLSGFFPMSAARISQDPQDLKISEEHDGNG